MKNGFNQSFGGGGGNSVAPKTAFTLAEVLITLGIIGVVAAMTMPSLIANYQKKVWVTQLKKDVSFVQNAYRSILADEGVDSIYETSFANTENPDICVSGDGACLNYKYDVNYFAKFFNLSSVPNNSKFYKYVNSTDYVPFLIKDGSCLAIDNSWHHYNKTGSKGNLKDTLYASVLIDVNCDKSPNKAGLDRFIFDFNEKGSIVYSFGFPYDTTDEGLKEMLNLCTKQTDKLIPDDFEYGDLLKEMLDSYRLYCGYLILRDGWEMNY